MQNLWPRIEGLLRDAGRDISRPARYLNHEWGCTYKDDADYHFCMIYPDTYELGQPNQAVRILCNVVNAVDGMYAERGYLPAADMIDLMRRESVPAFSLESCAPLRIWKAAMCRRSTMCSTKTRRSKRVPGCARNMTMCPRIS